MTNRKSPTSFPMSLRWTSYVAPNQQKGASKAIFSHFRIKKSGFSRRKSATKFLCVKTFSGKVVRHSLAYLSVHKWLVGDVTFDLKYWAKVTHSTPFKNGDFQSIFACSDCIVTKRDDCPYDRVMFLVRAGVRLLAALFIVFKGWSSSGGSGFYPPENFWNSSLL